jgi:hypothetical protein
MFYLAPEAGTGEKMVPAIMTHWSVSGIPVSQRRKQVPETG